MTTKAEALRFYLVNDYQDYINSDETDPKSVLRFYWIEENEDKQSVIDIQMKYYLQQLRKRITDSKIEADIEHSAWSFLSYAAKNAEVDMVTMALTMKAVNKSTGETTEIVKSPFMLFQEKGHKEISGVKIVDDPNFSNLDATTSINIFYPKPEYATFTNELKPVFDELVSEILEFKKGL